MDLLKLLKDDVCFDDVSLSTLAKTFGTPLYVMSETRIRENYNRLYSVLSNELAKVKLFYSAKANTNLSILRILKDAGANIDVVSPGEVFLALMAGYSNNQVFFTGTSVRDDELVYLLEKEVLINIDSLSQIKRLLTFGVPPVLSVRVNPQMGAGHHEHVITAGSKSKFGVWEDEAVTAYALAKDAGITHFGIHMHIGSGIMDINSFLIAAEKLLEIAQNIHNNVGICFDFVDFGGGIGIPYHPNGAVFKIEHFAKKLANVFKTRVNEYSLGEPELWLEPGRYLVANAGILLTHINTLKTTPFRRFAGVDAGFNTLIRPTMYGSYHHIMVVNKATQSLTETYDVVGPLCESGDILAKARLLPALAEGDLLAILDAGAYGYCMTSQYNSRPRPAEILLNNGSYKVIREPETFQDLLKGQTASTRWTKT